jgi:hypothetical protein
VLVLVLLKIELPMAVVVDDGEVVRLLAAEKEKNWNSSDIYLVILLISAIKL